MTKPFDLNHLETLYIGGKSVSQLLYRGEIIWQGNTILVRIKDKLNLTDDEVVHAALIIPDDAKIDTLLKWMNESDKVYPSMIIPDDMPINISMTEWPSERVEGYPAIIIPANIPIETILNMQENDNVLAERIRTTDHSIDTPLIITIKTDSVVSKIGVYEAGTSLDADVNNDELISTSLIIAKDVSKIYSPDLNIQDILSNCSSLIVSIDSVTGDKKIETVNVTEHLAGSLILYVDTVTNDRKIETVGVYQENRASLIPSTDMLSGEREVENVSINQKVNGVLVASVGILSGMTYVENITVNENIRGNLVSLAGQVVPTDNADMNSEIAVGAAKIPTILAEIQDDRVVKVVENVQASLVPGSFIDNLDDADVNVKFSYGASMITVHAAHVDELLNIPMENRSGGNMIVIKSISPETVENMDVTQDLFANKIRVLECNFISDDESSIITQEPLANKIRIKELEYFILVESINTQAESSVSLIQIEPISPKGAAPLNSEHDVFVSRIHYTTPTIITEMNMNIIPNPNVELIYLTPVEPEISADLSVTDGSKVEMIYSQSLDVTSGLRMICENDIFVELRLVAWEYPVIDGNKMRITQAHTITQNDSKIKIS